jgi:NADH-quinone oxidoreductase subunit N
MIHLIRGVLLFSPWSFAVIEEILKGSSLLPMIFLSEMSFLNNPIIIEIALILIISSLFFKLAIVPFNLWLPDVYEGASSPTTSFFALIPKLSVILFFIRLVFCGIFEFVLTLQYLLLFSGFLSIVFGSFSGLEERKLKSLLSFSAISNIGFIFLALSSNTLLSGQIVVCYIIIYTLANLCLWMIFFIFNPVKFIIYNKFNKELSNFSNFFNSNPIAAFLFSVLLFSLAGLPPFLGFLAKFGVFTIVIDSSLYLLAVLSILSSCVATFYYLRVVKIMFFEKKQQKVLFKQVNSTHFFLNVFTSFLSG